MTLLATYFGMKSIYPIVIIELKLSLIPTSTKLILKSKKTYILDRIMYKIHIKG